MIVSNQTASLFFKTKLTKLFTVTPTPTFVDLLNSIIYNNDQSVICQSTLRCQGAIASMQKKQLIMEKSLELFAKQGFEATSVQQITDYCGISKGAFYLSFKSKDELILALVDQFMKQFTSEIDYVVRNAGNEEVLSAFYRLLFTTFEKHSDFAKVFIKEQARSFNQELFQKMCHYDRLIDKSILLMLETLYGDRVKDTKFDLVCCIKGFINIYSSLFLFYKVPLDVDLLTKSLVDKTKILANYSTVSFLSKEYIHIITEGIDEEVTKEQLIELLDQHSKEIEEPIARESLILLKEQLAEPTYSDAIVKGLIENLRNHPHCKWIAYLLGNYYKY